jgi:hypothetical protein
MVRLKKNRISGGSACSGLVRKSLCLAPRAICAFLLLMSAAVLHAPAQSEIGVKAPDFNNDRVKAWDVTLTPGRPVSIGRQENDFVTLVLVGGEIRTTSSDGKTSVASRKFGDAVYARKGTEEKEELVSGTPARLIVVELKDHPVPLLTNKSGYPLAFPRPGSKKVLENDRIVVWNYTWTPGVPTPMHYHDKDTLAVYRYSGSVKSTTPDGKSVVNDHKFGDIWFNKGDRTHFEELAKGQQTAIIVELK